MLVLLYYTKNYEENLLIFEGLEGKLYLIFTKSVLFIIASIQSASEVSPAN